MGEDRSGRERTPLTTLIGDGVVLRPWTLADVPVMTTLFDTDEMDRWTPLAHPFDVAAATEYVRRADAAPASGTVQYAITVDGERPLGEVILFPHDDVTCEIAYAVGAAHRGRRLGERAVRVVLDAAARLGYTAAMLSIAEGNLGSETVATACGFVRSADPLRRRERKGYVLHMATWRRPLEAA